MQTGFDWVWYLVAGLMGVLGLWCALRARFHDPAKGRRRCPKCWYDMSGTPGLICSECGRSVKHEKQLFKTRRRLRWALVALVFFGLEGGAGLAPKVQRDGWPSVTPSTVLILMMPDLETRFPPAFKALQARMDQGDLAKWQWAFLLRRCAPNHYPPWILKITTAPSWPRYRAFGCHVQFHQKWTGRSYLDGARLQVSIRAAGNPKGTWVIVDRANSVELPWSCSNPPNFIDIPAQLTKGQTSVQLEIRIQRPAASNWTTIAAQRMTIPVRAVEHLDDAIQPVRSEELTREIKEHVWFELRSQLDLFQDFGYESMTDGITCPVQIELLRDGRAVTSADDWWDLGASANASRIRSFKLPPSLAALDDRELVQSTWHVRITSDAERALQATCATRRWDGQIMFTLQPQERDGRIILRSPAHDATPNCIEQSKQSQAE